MNIFAKKKEVMEAPRAGRVFVATSAGDVVPLGALKKAEIAKSSKQLQEEKQWVDDARLAERPYPPDSFLTLYESNPIFFRTVNQIAVDVAGLGWKLILKEGAKENGKEREMIQNFLSTPNPSQPLRKILQSLLIDWGTIGYFGLEVVRNNGGKVAEIYHVPAYTLWVHKGGSNNAGSKSRSGEKFCQKRGQDKLWFKQFGLKDEAGIEVNLSAKTGEVGDYDLMSRANELIFCKNYYPRNDHYGVPNILSATGSVLSLIGIRDYNLSFFSNYGVPAYLVTLTGEWEDGSDELIRKFLNTEVKGSENAHKTLVLQPPEGGKAEFERLSVDVKEGSFRIYNQILREDALAAYSMPPYRIGMAIAGKLGGNVAREATEVYKESVVEPLQEDIEDIVNMKLIEQGLDCHSYKFKLNDLDIRDTDAEVERYNSMIEHGWMTPNEARNRLDMGKGPPEGDEFYISRTLTEMSTRVSA